MNTYLDVLRVSFRKTLAWYQIFNHTKCQCIVSWDVQCPLHSNVCFWDCHLVIGISGHQGLSNKEKKGGPTGNNVFWKGQPVGVQLWGYTTDDGEESTLLIIKSRWSGGAKFKILVTQRKRVKRSWKRWAKIFISCYLVLCLNDRHDMLHICLVLLIIATTSHFKL